MTKDEALKLAMEAMEITGGFDIEINVIKEALADTSPNFNCKSVQARLATAWGYVKAQPEQETPKGWKSEIWKSVKQQEQESVTWGVDWGKAGDIPCVSIIKRVPNGSIEVMAVEYAPYSYTTPPQRTWFGLTDEEISELIRATHNTGSFVRAIEAKLKEKNVICKN